MIERLTRRGDPVKTTGVNHNMIGLWTTSDQVTLGVEAQWIVVGRVIRDHNVEATERGFILQQGTRAGVHQERQTWGHSIHQPFATCHQLAVRHQPDLDVGIDVHIDYSCIENQRKNVLLKIIIITNCTSIYHILCFNQRCLLCWIRLIDGNWYPVLCTLPVVRSWHAPSQAHSNSCQR